MTGGLTELPEGQQLPVRRRWWRHARYLALVVLAVLSLLALIVGRVTGAELDQRASEPAVPSPVRSSAPDSVDAICRPPVASPAQEPWLTDRAAAETVWQEHSADLAEEYFVGPNGWIFWNDYVDQYASQAVGRALLTDTQVQQWVAHLTDVRDSLAERGVEFYVIVTPSTSSIYPEELPTWMQDLRGSTIMDQVIGATGDLPIMDLRADLVSQKDPAFNLFSWSNSHWTDFGAYTAWKQIAACGNAMFPDGGQLQVPETTGAAVIGDFNEWEPYGVPSPGEDWAVPVYAEPLQDVVRTDKDGLTTTVTGETATDLLMLPAETTVEAPWTGKSALIFRDSMGGGLSPLWQQSYSPSWQVVQPYVAGYAGSGTYEAAVAQYDPDVVIVQLAERYLLNAPAYGAGY